MTKKTLLFAIAIAALGLGSYVFAADHRDSTTLLEDPAADINDVYAFMVEPPLPTATAALRPRSIAPTHLLAAMTVFPFANGASQFSDAVHYVLHISSSAAYGEDQEEKRVICEFDEGATEEDPMQVECELGDIHVHGDVGDNLASEDGKVRVFAGLRDDPFFFELNGFNHTVSTVKAAASGLTFDAQGCPLLSNETAAALRDQLQHGTTGEEAASNTFANANTLAIVVQIEKSLVTGNGPILGVWASTHQR